MNQPRPIPIVSLKEQHKFTLDVAQLEDILLQDHIKDCHVVVVSVAGSFRKGKSFLLDFFLRFMNHTCKSDQTTNASWLGDENSPLEGFSWRGGLERNTTGIVMWSEVFPVTLPNGDKVAVILLDTQGTFDCKSTVQECATVFALSTMLSSIQVYNLFHNIQEDDLQHLQLFTEYGRLALEGADYKPFQKLQFLVRDWSYPYEANYGLEGGRKLLDKTLKISDEQHPVLQSLRKDIASCFTDIQCFLMPHPGFKATTNPAFDGRLSDLENEFKTCLEQFVPILLSPENMIQKEIGGEKIKAKDLVRYFKCYMELFSGDDIPQPKSILAATAEAANQSALAAAKEMYNQLILAICEAAEPYLSSEELEKEHEKCKAEAIEKFTQKSKIGGDEFSKEYRIKLEQDIDKEFNRFKTFNESKGKASNQLAVSKAKDTYRRLMTEICEASLSCLSSDELQLKHEECKKEALEQFEETFQMAEENVLTLFRIKLKQDIDEYYEQFKSSNQNRIQISYQLSYIKAKQFYHHHMVSSTEEGIRTDLSSEELLQMHIKYKNQVLKHLSETYKEEFTEIRKTQLEQNKPEIQKSRIFLAKPVLFPAPWGEANFRKNETSLKRKTGSALAKQVPPPKGLFRT
ncbi:atlastin-like [Planococcus citri]|uniref:atlastin-like n=1 Tax=Planococcus citri TaxID=170843 RepID=UPI0031F75E85